MNDREEFERAYAKSSALDLADVRSAWDGEIYEDQGMRDAWWGWQARAALSASPAPSGEVEAVEVVGNLYRDALGEVRIIPRGDPHIKDGMGVVTADEHQRIVAANGAEIARVAEEADRYRNERDAWIGRSTELQGGDDELRAQLSEKDTEIARLELELKDSDEHGDREEMRANGYAAQLVELRAQLAAQQAAVPEWASKLLHEASKLGRDIWAGGLQTGGEQYPNAHCCIDLAQRIDKAMRNAPTAPQQGVVMPEEPTAEMYEAAQDIAIAGLDGELFTLNSSEIRELYQAMYSRLNADRSAQGEKP